MGQNDIDVCSRRNAVGQVFVVVVHLQRDLVIPRRGKDVIGRVSRLPGLGTEVPVLVIEIPLIPADAPGSVAACRTVEIGIGSGIEEDLAQGTVRGRLAGAQRKSVALALVRSMLRITAVGLMLVMVDRHSSVSLPALMKSVTRSVVVQTPGLLNVAVVVEDVGCIPVLCSKLQ